MTEVILSQPSPTAPVAVKPETETIPTIPKKPFLGDLFLKSFDGFPAEGDLAPTMPAEAVNSPQLTLSEVAHRTGYDAALIRRAVGPGPYFTDDLSRIYWRNRRLWHTDYDAKVHLEYRVTYRDQGCTCRACVARRPGPAKPEVAVA